MSKKSKVAPPESGFEQALNKYVDNYTLADHPELVPGIFNRLGLDGYLTFFQEHGHRPSPANVYHGVDHSLQVALNCYEGGLYNHLSNGELKLLVVAGLFHDASHSQGRDSDRANVAAALRTLSVAHEFTPEHQKLKPLELAMAQEAIRLTEYPYKGKTTSTLGRIIRDADAMTMYTADPDLLLDLFLGLINETATSRHHQYLYSQVVSNSIEAFCLKQGEYVLKQEWATAWGKLKAYHRNWPQAWRRLHQLLQLSQRVIA